MTDARKWKQVAAFLLFGGVFLWTTFYGNPLNALHVSAQSWGCWACLGILAGGKLGELVHSWVNKAPTP